MRSVFLVGACLLLGANSVMADDITLASAIKEGDTKLSFRTRYEDVNETAAHEKGAQALTLRSRLSFETKQYKLFSALLEFDDVIAIPDDDNYNSTSNGQTDDAVVLDPEGTELNRIWLAFDIANTLIKYGRQNISLDNERFFGKDEWRQNEQTFTGVSLLNESLNYLRIRMAQLNQVEGVQGESSPNGHRDFDAKIVNIEYRGFVNSKLALYGYWLDSDYLNNQEDTMTYGLRFSGRIKNEPEIDYAFEYARQSDSNDHEQSYEANYSLLEAGVVYNKFRLGVGQEILGADGLGYFVTPLASLHNFQGWTDQFQNQGLGNILGGIEDRYVSLGFSCAENFNITGVYHQYKSDSQRFGLGDLGTEWGLEASGELNEYRFNLKYAEYSKKNFGIDTEKLWLSAGVSF